MNPPSASVNGNDVQSGIFGLRPGFALDAAVCDVLQKGHATKVWDLSDQGHVIQLQAALNDEDPYVLVLRPPLEVFSGVVNGKGACSEERARRAMK
eukprot:2505498-Pyramimonas_sp.AAC.1